MSELRFHAPVLRETIRRLWARHPNLQVRLPVATTLSLEVVREAFPDPRIQLRDTSRESMEWADAAIVASGTATLETALVGTPFCLMYILSPSSGWLLKHVVRYRGFYGMPNLLHGREVIREFLQEKATPDALYAEISLLLENETYRKRMVETFGICRDKLGMPGASGRAAAQILGFLKARNVGFDFAVPELS